MKIYSRNRLAGLALAGSLSLLGANNAFAAAGDTISNTASLSYDVSGTTQPAITASVDFIEDRLINFVVSTADGATVSVAPSATTQVQSFDVTNNGNDTQDFLFTALDRTTGTADPHGGAQTDNFDVSSVSVYVDTVLDGNYVPADDTAVFADEVAPGATVRVFVVSTIPDNTVVSNGDVAVMALIAQVAAGGGAAVEGAAITNDDNGNVSPAGSYSNGATSVAAGVANDIADDPATTQTVFNDPAGTIDSQGNAGAVQTGQTSGDSSYTVAAASLTVTKTSSALWDPVNLATNPKSIPGGYVRYSISVDNAAGAANADLTTLSDTLSASLDLDPDFTDGTAANNPSNAAGDSIQVVKGATTIYCTAAADGDGCDYTGGAGGTVTVDMSNATFAGIMPLAGGETVTVNFNVIVQ